MRHPDRHFRGRDHEQCADCGLETADPVRCDGHGPGPSHCADFVPKILSEPQVIVRRIEPGEPITIAEIGPDQMFTIDQIDVMPRGENDARVVLDDGGRHRGEFSGTNVNIKDARFLESIHAIADQSCTVRITGRAINARRVRVANAKAVKKTIIKDIPMAPEFPPKPPNRWKKIGKTLEEK